MRASPGMNDLERAFVEFERADAAEADVAALRAEEQAVLASAGCKTMVELAAKLQSLKDASGAEALHDAVEAPRGTAAAAAANGPPALKPGLKPLRYEDCLDGNNEKQIRGSTPGSSPSHSAPSLPATRRARGHATTPRGRPRRGRRLAQGREGHLAHPPRALRGRLRRLPRKVRERDPRGARAREGGKRRTIWA